MGTNGWSNKGLAEQLKISEGTLKLHLHHIYRKTGVSGRSGLITLVGHLGDDIDNPLSAISRLQRVL